MINSQNKRVLVAGDDASIRESVKNVLAQADYAVLAATTAESLAKLDSGSIDLLVLDIDVAGRGTWEMLQQFASNHPLVPVVILTGGPNARNAALAAGASVLFEKPVEPAELLKTLQTLLVSNQGQG